LDRINQIRTASGLSPVTANDGWVTGIDDHLTYLEQTPASYETGQYANAHTENPSSPYYTSAGATEADRSDLAFGTGSDLDAINEWLTAPFHAIGMLRPGLTQVAFARHDGSGDAGLDVIGGLSGGQATTPVLFPGNGSTIDLTTYGGESPSPIETCTADHPGADYSNPGLGLIALLTKVPTGDIQVTLRQPDGSTISSTNDDLCVVDENNYTSSDSVYGPTGQAILQGDHAVLIFPRQPLVTGTYAVTIVQGGQPDITWSFTSQPAGPAAPPAAPAQVSAVAGDRSAKVTWSPAAPNGSDVTGYTVQSSPAGGSCSTTSVSCNVTGLTDGTSYTFTVAAHSAAGDGPPSAPSAPVTPKGAPTAPTSVVASGHRGGATVSWHAPADDNGSAVTGYTVQWARCQFTRQCKAKQQTTPATTLRLTLPAGHRYYFRVRAANAVGASVWSHDASAVPRN
jgi:hypothetical protein